jgi:hypothetical protein
MKIVISPAKSLNFDKELPTAVLQNLIFKGIKTDSERK